MFEDLAVLLLPVATYVLVASCKGSVAIAFVLLCRKLFAARLSAQLRHGLWLLAIASLLVPGFPLSLELRRDPPVMSAIVAGAKHAESDHLPAMLAMPASSQSGNVAPDYLVTPSSAPEVSSGAIPMQSWLMLLWAAVVLALAAVPAWNLIRYRRITAQATAVPGPVQQLLLQCGMQMRLRRGVRLLESAEVASPAVFGWLSPTLLLPNGLQQRLDADQLRHVFLHELGHVQRHDILANWLAACAQILHWFNPLVWYGLRVMRADMEQACDATVLAQLSPHEHADYGQTLIGVLDAFPGRTPAQALGVIDGHRQLKERLIMIAGFQSRKLLSPVLAVAMLLGLTSVALTQPQVGTQSPARAIANSAARTPPAIVPARVAQASQPAEATQPPPVSSAMPAVPRGLDAADAAPAPRPMAAAPSVATPVMPANVFTMEQLIGQVSKNIQKRIIADPRARANITLYGQRLEDIDYAGLLTILRVNDFTAVELNGYINVVPLAVARTLPVPIVIGGKTYPDDQIVSARISLTRACAASMSPMLRQMVSQFGTMMADNGSNSILMVDTFANFKRLESTVRDLDLNTKSADQCGPAVAVASTPTKG